MLSSEDLETCQGDPLEPGNGEVASEHADPAAAEHETQTFERLVDGRYRLVAVIGQGSMGRVWRARDEVLGRDVAVKEVFLPPGLSEADTDVLRERVMREARSAAQFSHPAVLTVHDVVEDDGRPWIVMELLHGRSLEQVIADDGPLSLLDTVGMGQDLLAGLMAAHAAGVLHRDVKPANVLLRSDGQAVLTDFGLAAIDGEASLTREGMVAGSPSYASPERIGGAPASAASDLWSLGGTLYAAVEGKGPFDDRGDIIATIAAIVREDPPSPRTAGPLTGVISALLSRDPAARPSAAATLRMLEVAADELGGTPGRRDPRPGVTERPAPRRVRRAAVAAAVAGACVVLVPVSVWALQRKPAEPRTRLQASQSLPSSPAPSATPSASASPSKPARHKEPAASARSSHGTKAKRTTAGTVHPQAPASQAVSQEAAPPVQAPAAPRTTAPHTTAPPRPFAISGEVSCISGAGVQGVYVEAAKGAGFSPWTGQGDDSTATFDYTLPEKESFSLHVGCGGSPSAWKVATYSVTVSTAVTDFACDDVPGQAAYGTCRVS